jgi:hypothetical protein
MMHLPVPYRQRSFALSGRSRFGGSDTQGGALGCLVCAFQAEYVINVGGDSQTRQPLRDFLAEPAHQPEGP